jgi:glutamate/tyrosine decarboxylase-like PLP-dependent enzyme
VKKLSEKGKEETLDPEDWEQMKTLAKKMAEDMISYQQNIREKPVVKKIPQQILDLFNEPVPRKPQGPEKTYQEFQQKIASNITAFNTHPRFWATVIGTGTPFGALADMWASGLNHPVIWPPDLPHTVELQVINWIKQMLEYPEDASGVLVSGGSIANLIGLTVARNVKAGYNVKKKGITKKLTFYGSTEAHSCIQRNLELLGVGEENLRKIPVDENYKIKILSLKKRVQEDRENGFTPICVIGNAGSTNTGSVDDLEALAEYCEEQGLWFHVDGALGSFAALSTKYKHIVKGMNKADSLAVDLHKWMYMPYGVGCTLIRHPKEHHEAFSIHAPYIEHEDVWLSDLGIEQSRPNRALKVWMSLKEHGADKYGSVIEQDIEYAKYFAGLVAKSNELELLAPVYLNVVCFRYVRDDSSESELDVLNAALFEKIIWEGKFGPFNTTIDGKFAFRICTVNHRTTREDLRLFYEEILENGKNINP